MPSIKVSDRTGQTKVVEFESGLSLMEALRDAGYEEIEAICGGSCSCATCHVHIKSSSDIELPTMEEDELVLLELADDYQAERSRLSCQIDLSDAHDGLYVDLVDPS